MTASAPTKPRSRIVRFLLPSIDPQSALIPSDRWILRAVRDSIAEQKQLVPAALKSFALGLGALGALALGTAGAILAAAAVPATACAVTGIVLAAACGKKFFDKLQDIRTRILPEVGEHVKAKYALLKINEIKSAWQTRAALLRDNPELRKPAPPKVKKVTTLQEDFKSWAKRKIVASLRPQKPAQKPDAPKS